ncbi:threonine--tRNA ligase [Candidatus Giovannonibacteria bacterium]|nr:threonine--tRNA ligase [Candidatus Giovannonibacteria bacterium]
MKNKIKKAPLHNSSLENIRHSLAHLLASAVLKIFPKAKLGIGPVIESGFYYDFLLPRPISDNELAKIEELMRQEIKQDLEFRGKSVTANNAKKTFKDQPFKLDLIKEFSKEKKNLTLYQSGNFIDLCRGGHVSNTKEINPEAFKLIKIAGAYWRGDEKNPQLTRIYGAAFENKNELDEYVARMKKAEESDHRKLGEELDLFMMDEDIGRGLPLWLPNGFTVRKILEDYMFELERAQNYKHVFTPHIAKEAIYKKSGHLSHYKDDMYSPLIIDDEKYYLKPMNCPHHHVIYRRSKKSYRELPLRLAEFGTVYRYERSGVLSGLMRTRNFTQNDAHIYLTPNHLETELTKILEMHKNVYTEFEMENYWYRLSLPDFKKKEKFGDIKNKKMWAAGEKALRGALANNGLDFVEGLGEASFYGPKIDIQVKNLYGREETIATVQVDFYSAGKFDLNYVDASGKEVPVVIIHRAILGSFDRFFAFLLENTGGRLPFWLSPVQVKILAVNDKVLEYAKEIEEYLLEKNIRVGLDLRNETVGKKIREGELQKIPYLFVIGEKEVVAKKIAVRERGKGDLGLKTIEEFFELSKI